MIGKILLDHAEAAMAAGDRIRSLVNDPPPGSLERALSAGLAGDLASAPSDAFSFLQRISETVSRVEA